MKYLKKTPEIEKFNIDLNKYDTIIIGSPVWWYTIAPPVRTFLKENDFKGKKVFAFATNAGWLGSTFNEIKSLCNGEILNCLNVKFSTDGKDLLTKEQDIYNLIEKIKS